MPPACSRIPETSDADRERGQESDEREDRRQDRTDGDRRGEFDEVEDAAPCQDEDIEERVPPEFCAGRPTLELRIAPQGADTDSKNRGRACTASVMRTPLTVVKVLRQCLLLNIERRRRLRLSAHNPHQADIRCIYVVA